MKTLVIGATGLLGPALLRQLTTAGDTPLSASRHTPVPVDITSPASVEECLAANAPESVILAAAATDVDGVESDPDRAYRVNALGARNVAAACLRRGLGLTYISTDYVFSGHSDQPYTEFDSPDPAGVYGRTKRLGEQFCLEVCPGSQVVRIAGVYGPDGPCFPGKILQAATQGRPLRLIADWQNSFTSTRQAARVIVRLRQQGSPGSYHVVGRGGASPYQVAERALRAAGMGEIKIEAIRGSDWKAAAPRPAYSVLHRYMLELEGQDDLEPWEEEIDHFAADWVAIQRQKPQT